MNSTSHPVSTQFDDVYFSRDDAVAESRHVFLAGNNLPVAWQGRDTFTIGELGFGTGRSMLLAAQLFQQTAPANQQLNLYSVERYPMPVGEVQAALAALGLDVGSMLDAYKTSGTWQWQPAPNIMLTVMCCDVRDAIPHWPAIDAWFLDGFAPAKNPDMWDAGVCQLIAQHSRPGSTFATYTAAVAVRRNLQAAGFETSMQPGHGKKREMTVGQFTGTV